MLDYQTPTEGVGACSKIIDIGAIGQASCIDIEGIGRTACLCHVGHREDFIADDGVDFYGGGRIDSL